MGIMRCVYFIFAALLLVGCEDGWNKGNCPVTLSFSDDFVTVMESWQTKSAADLPDTNDFILEIKVAESGEVMFKDVYKNRPSEITLPEGAYSFVVYSCEFAGPAFDAPQFGDEQEVLLTPSGVDISFVCKQLNTGLRCIFDDKFRGQFPSSKVVLSQDDDSLVYTYDEDRIAYLRPGQVELSLVTGGSRRHLISRNLESNAILTINFSVDISSKSAADYSIAIDTGRVWISENYIYGKERDGSAMSRALEVGDLSAMAGSDDVWVKGYIVGGDLSSSSASYTAPFTSRTNFMISDKPTVSSRNGCVSVELKSGAIRDGLNLVDHSQYLGKMVYLKGDIVESYYGLTGIKGLSEYSFN